MESIKDRKIIIYSPSDDDDVFDSADAATLSHATLFEPIDWTAESGFPAHADRMLTYPRRGLGSGSHMGLTVVANVRANDYYCSTTNSAGFKVLLHPPTETPQIADYGIAIAPGQESRVIIKPLLSVASDLIRSIPLAQRQCIFADEANLTYFRYKKHNRL